MGLRYLLRDVAWRGSALGWQQLKFNTPPLVHTLLTTCNMPTLGPHQSSWTAVQPRPTNMFLDPLGVVSHLHFTALELDVSWLSCTPAKMASVPVSFGAITLPRLHCLAPAQFLRVPHHPGCHEKS